MTLLGHCTACGADIIDFVTGELAWCDMNNNLTYLNQLQIEEWKAMNEQLIKEGKCWRCNAPLVIKSC